MFDSPVKGKDCYLIYSGGIARGGCIAAGMKVGSGSNQRQLRQSMPNEKAPSIETEGFVYFLVAGVGFEPTTFGL